MVNTNHTDLAVTTELTSVADVLERYQSEGPHATAVMPLATPGQRGDDRHIRWHAMRTDLHHLGADGEMLARLDHVVKTLEPKGIPVLITASPTGSAFCWLSDESAPSVTHFGVHPALIPVLVELAGRAPVVGAVVDRFGADLFEFGHLGFVQTGTVTGDEEFAERGAGGDQASFQRRVELGLERTAADAATALANLAGSAGASLIVLTGDDRAVAAVEHHLGRHEVLVRHVQAGGRHEPSTPERLHRAARDEVGREHERQVADAVDHLMRELATHDRAIAGHVATFEAIEEGRVDTLFLDAGTTAGLTDADALVKEVLSMGGSVIVAADLQVPDGTAALLRFAYN